MTTVIMLTLWATAISGWATAYHFYTAASHNSPPSTNFVIRCVIAAAISLAIGTSLLSAINNVSAFHGAFGF